MSITTDARAIYPGVPVLLNLGFSQAKYAKKSRFVAYPVLCYLYVKHLAEVLEPGWKAEVMHGTEERETTLIVKGVFNYAASHTDLLWQLVERACQDCIAIYYPNEDIGFLFGPEAAAWGEFNINLFDEGAFQMSTFKVGDVVKSGHSGVHDGLQNHSVGEAYPLAVVTYGHDPAIHVIENLKDGTVACHYDSVPLQTPSAKAAFQWLAQIITKECPALVSWSKGRPKNVGGRLIIPKPLPQHNPKRELFLAATAESLRVGRELTPFELYQVACDVDNR